MQESISLKRSSDQSLEKGADDVTVVVHEDGDISGKDKFLEHNGLQGEGSVLCFDSINYEVTVTNLESRKCCGAKVSRSILKNVSGVYKPGLNAILGPTGSGKTTLLDVVAGRRDTAGTRLTGQVQLDGQPLPSNFKYISGYVMQDDLVMDMLTVRENVMFSAALRLPGSSSSKLHHQRVSQILSELGLDTCADTRVGTVFIRGVSGGERKRTNIAMELVNSPAVLFLDEPTSGLDANTAYSVIHLLHRLSRRGMTIVLSIHQPRFAIYKLFDSLTLLSRGETVYFGPTAEALDHFESAGYICEQHNCPSDFFLDIITGGIHSSTLHKIPNEKSVNGSVKEEDSNLLLFNGTGTTSSEEHQKSLVDAYRSSEGYNRLNEELSSIKNIEDSKVSIVKPYHHATYQTSFCRQFSVVGKRTWLTVVRNTHALATQILSGIILGLIVGAIYFRTGSSGPREAFQNRVGAFFFIVMNYVFGNMTAVDLFIKERALFIHETVSGYYRVSAYFLSKLLCDVVPQRLFPVTMFAVVSYFLIGFQLSISHFLFYLLNMFLTSMSGTAVALVFSATTSQHTIGTLLTALVWTCMMVFSGMLVLVDTIPVWLQWLKWFSIFRYSMNAFQINEFKDLFVCDPAANLTLTSHPHQTVKFNCSGNEYLEDQGIPYERSGTADLLLNELALFIILVSLLLLTYVQLRRTKPFH